MAVQFQAGTASIKISPDLTGFHRRVKTQLRAERVEAPVIIVPDMSRFKQELTAKLSNVTAKIKVEVAPDLTNFSQQLRTRLGAINANLRVQVTPDFSGFAADLHSHLGASAANITIPVDLDFTRAREQLLLFRLEASHAMRADFDLDITAALAQLAALHAASQGIGGAAGGIGSIGSAASGMLNPVSLATMALVALAAVSLIPLIGQLAQAAGVISLLPAVAAAAAAGIATIVIGSTGIFDAFSKGSKAAEEAAKNAAKTAKQQATEARERASAAKAVASAQRGVEKAADGVARAERGVGTALDNVERAERGVIQAQKKSEDAQKSLTRARKDAQEQIEDLNLALKGSALDERGAKLAVRRAEQQLRDLWKGGQPVTPLDVSEAVLGVDEAKQRLDEVRERNGDLREEVDAANKAGVEGSEQVVSAKEAIAEADQGVIDSQKSLADSHLAVADAQAAVLDAQQNLADSQEAVIDAQQRAAEATIASTDALDKYSLALADLSPNAREFVEQTRSLGDAWKELRIQVQDNLFAGLGGSITDLATNYFPILKNGLGGIATEINIGLKGALADLSSESSKLDWTNILENTRISMQPVIDGLSSLFGGLTNIASIGSDFLPGLSGSFADTMARFEEWTASEEGQNKIRTFMEDSIRALGEIKDLFVEIGRVVGGLFTTSDESGKSMVQSLTETMREFADWMRTAEGQEKMKAFWEDVRHTVTDILNLVKEAIKLANILFPSGGRTGPGAGPNDPNAPEGNARNSGAVPPMGAVIDGSAVDPGHVGGFQYNLDMSGAWRFLRNDNDNGALRNIKDWWNGAFGPGDGETKEQREARENGQLPTTVPGPNTGGGRSGGQKQYTREEWEKTFGDVEEFDRQLDELQRKSIETQQVGSSNFGTLGSNVAQSLLSLSTGDFEGFKTSLGNLGRNILGTTEDGGINWGNLGSKIGEVVGNITNTIFPGFREGLGTLLEFGRGIVEGFGGNWDRLKEMAAGPINWIIDHVINGTLKNAWNAVAKVIPGLSGWDGVARIEIPGAAKSEGGPNLVQRYATGGHVRGRGGPTDDLIDAKLSNGEYVMRASAVDKIGVANLDRLNNNPLVAKGKVLAEGMFTGIRMKVGGSVDEAVARAKGFMQHESGKPYQYGGTGNPSWDCSGLWSGIVNELSGRPATSGRLFNTESDFESMGWKPGLDGRVTIGIMRGGGGENSHMAGTIDGTNAESSGDNGVQWGGPARGSDNSMFGLQYTLQELAGQFASGGQGGGMGGLFRSVLNTVYKPAAAAFEAASSALGSRIPDFGPSLVGQIPKVAFTAIKDALSSAIRNAMGASSSSDSGNTPYDIGAGAEQWRPLVEKLFQEKGQPADLIDKYLYQIQRESSGNPNAINNYDVNAQNGTPSKGLAQVIDPTFQSYKDPGYEDIWDPESNLRASLNYLIRDPKFGGRGVAALTGAGYALGGIIPGYSPGQDKFQVGVSGGESIMRPEWTRAVGPSFVDGMNSIARKQGVEGVQRAMGMFAQGGVFDPEEARLYAEGRFAQFGTQVGDIAKSAIPEILGVQGTPLDPNHRYWQAAMDINAAVQGAQAVAPVVSDQAGSNSIQSAIAEGGRVIEEHIHYHVADMAEAIQKERIRQQQQALSFTGR